MAAFNQHSFIVMVIILLGAAGMAVWRVRRGRLLWRIGGWITLAILLGGLWLLLRPTPAIHVASLSEAESQIGSGVPAVLEFYSSY